MVSTVLLGNGVVITGGRQPRVIHDGMVVWRGDRITAVGPANEIGPMHASGRVINAHGGLILPGLVNLHHHFYSALARGLDPGAPMGSFGDVLEHLWWRLDRALDPETVRLSALLTLADCIRCGVTTVFDHHASPSCLRGSLDLIAEAVQTAGLSAVLSYEISDRNGHDEAMDGLAENLDFVRRHAAHPRLRGMIGLHASFTLSDETLDEVARQRTPQTGCHVHVAEDRLDVERSLSRFGLAPAQRLHRFGLLDEHAVLAHGVHLDGESLDLVAASGSVLVHNPESNANNGVGRLDVPAAAARGCLVGLGTDGMSSSMLRAVRAAFLAHRAATGDPAQGFTALPDLLLANNVTAAQRFFGEPALGELRPGAPADIVVVDAPPPTPLDDHNLFGHLVYGASEAAVRHTVARGRVLLDDFRLRTLDPSALAAQARAVAPQLWRRFHSLSH